MKLFLLAALLNSVAALPILLGQSGGSSSEQRFNVYPPQILPFFPQFPLPQAPLIPIPFPFPFDPNQVLTPSQLLALITSILNQLQGFLGGEFTKFKIIDINTTFEVIFTATSEDTHEEKILRNHSKPNCLTCEMPEAGVALSGAGVQVTCSIFCSLERSYHLVDYTMFCETSNTTSKSTIYSHML